MKKTVQGVIQAVAIAAILALAGAYMQLHDTQRDVAELRSKLEWLYRYTFPLDQR